MQLRGRLRRTLCVTAVLATAACGADRPSPIPTIAFLGDSITYGVVRGPRGGRGVEVDPQGGYPGRLARRLGDRARVLNRGIGGATTGLWLASPESPEGRAMWGLVQHAPWFEPALVPRGESVALAALTGVHADVVVLLVGVNDLYVRRVEGAVALESALDGVTRLAGQAATVAPTVLVATPLPNHRDAPEEIAALRAGIHARFPDALPLGERFAALRWEPLLADEVHPSRAGYERLAILFETLLLERGLIAPAPAP
jgi:lysophospholipase L1-like esterase